MKPKPLPVELENDRVQIESEMKGLGLDFFNTIYQVHDYNSIKELIAYLGFPRRYPHWSFGRDHMIYEYGYNYGNQKVYEMVINNDPSYAYLLENNDLAIQRMVIAHVYGHVDFFKNNLWFSKTERNAVEKFYEDALLVESFMDEYGYGKVVSFLDKCLQLKGLIDFHSQFMEEVEKQEQPDVLEDVDPWMKDFIMTEEYKAKLEQQEKEQLEKESRFPQKLEKDILKFLFENASRNNRKIESWQLELLRIMRDESYYFAPQMMTKIMNEGWAVYWHSKMMSHHGWAKDDGIGLYSKTHAGVLRHGLLNINPYQIGYELYKHIENKWNKGRHGFDFDRCKNQKRKDEWDTHAMEGLEKIFEVRKRYNDILFLNEFLDQEFCDQEKLYDYEPDYQRQQLIIKSRDHRVIKQKLIKQLVNGGQPLLYVKNGDYNEEGELLLYHDFDGRIMDLRWAAPVMHTLSKIWGRNVHLQTEFMLKKDGGFEPVVISCVDKGKKLIAQKFNVDKEEGEGEKHILAKGDDEDEKN